jgi:diacylglycerol kinase family enzyme
MRRVALIYNPVSGNHSARRSDTLLREVLAVLQNAGVEAEMLETTGPRTAGLRAQEAVRNGCDTILACGGDGTAHEVLQGLVGTPTALGVIPLGTANALAHNLELGSSPLHAVRALLTAVPTPVRVGRIFYHDSAGTEQSSYFTVAAGIGIDALIMSRQNPGLKRRFGYLLYVLEVIRIWATNPFPLYEATFTDESTPPRVEQISELLEIRIRTFGALLGTLAPGATLNSNTLHLIAFKTRSRLSYLRFLLAVMFRLPPFSSRIELLQATSVECRASQRSTAAVYVEADGEVLGALPARIEMAPENLTLTLLIPPNARP